MAKKKVLSGMRPSGRLHLGHLHGVLENWKKLQDNYQSLFFVADWHALTSEYANSSVIKENIPEMVIDWLSVGIDPDKATMFLQSSILEHAELQLLFSMIVPLSWLERNPTYKEQIQEIKGRDLSTFGFLGYPVLQAADILIYKAEVVPIGVDQLPHLELTREIARRFNFLYGDVLPIPEAHMTEIPKLTGLDGRKMSKSYGNVILISDPPETIKKKILPMVTCPHRIKRTDPGHTEHCPVFTLHELYSSREELDYVTDGCTKASIGCIDCKTVLIDNIIRYMSPIHEKRKEYAGNPDLIFDILSEGNVKARKVAQETMILIRDAVFK